MNLSREVRLVLIIAALGAGTWLLAQSSPNPPPKSERQSAGFSLCNHNNDVLMLDGIHGKTWMLRKVEAGKPTWIPIPRIDSEKEAAQAWQKSSDNAVKVGKTEQPLSLDAFLTERGYAGIPLCKLRTGLLCIEPRVEGRKVFLAVDSGSTYTYLDKQRVKHLQLQWQSFGNESDKAGNLTAPFNSWCQVTKFEVAGSEIGRIIIGANDLSDINNSLKSYMDPQIDGLLGSDILSKLNAMIDYSTTKLYIRMR